MAPKTARTALGAVSVFDAIRTGFDALGTRPDPLCVDGTKLPGLPPRNVPVTELKTLLLESGCSQVTRDAVWAVLVSRARTETEGGVWRQACLGLARPMLMSEARRLSKAVTPDEAEDVLGAVLVGFLDGLVILDLTQGWIARRLKARSCNAGVAALHEMRRQPLPVEHTSTTTPTPIVVEAGHPEQVLQRAVTDGVLTDRQAELIAATRLEHRTVLDYAREHSASYGACRKARSRAEAVLRRYLLGTHPASPPHPAQECETGDTAPACCGRSCPKSGSANAVQGCPPRSADATASTQEGR